MTEVHAQHTLAWSPIADLNEMRSLGILHEVNRLLLHPVGLALGIKHEEDLEPQLVLYDGRDDPEGIIFSDDTLDAAKATTFAQLMKDGVERRLQAFGYGVQPINETATQLLLSLRESFEGHGPNAEDAEAQVRDAAGMPDEPDPFSDVPFEDEADAMTGAIDLDPDGGA